MFDCVVIGAGVVGAMTARELTRLNLDVCIVDKENDVAMGATKANSAIVHAGFDAKEGSLKARLNVQGSKMMAQVASELGVKYKNNGSLVIGFDNDDIKTIEELYKRGVDNGVEGLEILDAKKLREIEPNISANAVAALYAPTGAIICPYELTVAAIGNAMDNGAELRLNFCVEKITKIPDGYELVSGEDRIETRIVINAAGLYSDRIASMIGDNSFNIHPRRGEYILLDKEAGEIVEKTIFRTPGKMGKGILVSPTVDGNLLTGPTSEDMEADEKENKDTTAQGLDRIIKEACENVEEVNYRKSITSFCGLRAVGSTGDFIITSPCRGFINAAGIESPGLSASPAIAEYIAGMLTAQGYELSERDDFNPCREPMHYFREADIERKNEIIKKDKSFGRIICRCEGVTEGEILQAIRTNPRPRDLDGVKRRTRAQMGRCQGGFCMPYIVNILSKELGIPVEKVTKCGRGSVINYSETKGAGSND